VRTNAQLASALRTIAAELDRVAPWRPLPAAVIEALGDGAMSANALTRRLQRRKGDVLATVRQLAADGRIKRQGSRWEIS
jgi:hypothetical protein